MTYWAAPHLFSNDPKIWEARNDAYRTDRFLYTMVSKRGQWRYSKHVQDKFWKVMPCALRVRYRMIARSDNATLSAFELDLGSVDALDYSPLIQNLEQLNDPVFAAFKPSDEDLRSPDDMEYFDPSGSGSRDRVNLSVLMRCAVEAIEIARHEYETRSNSYRIPDGFTRAPDLYYGVWVWIGAEDISLTDRLLKAREIIESDNCSPREKARILECAWRGW